MPIFVFRDPIEQQLICFARINSIGRIETDNQINRRQMIQLRQTTRNIEIHFFAPLRQLYIATNILLQQLNEIGTINVYEHHLRYHIIIYRVDVS